MKTALVFFAVVAAIAIARPQEESADLLPPSSRTDVRDLKGQYNFDFETVTGTKESAQGRLVENDAKNDTVLIQSGKYKFITPEGFEVFVKWFADKTGFHAEGPTIPK